MVTGPVSSVQLNSNEAMAVVEFSKSGCAAEAVRKLDGSKLCGRNITLRLDGATPTDSATAAASGPKAAAKPSRGVLRKSEAAAGSGRKPNKILKKSTEKGPGGDVENESNAATREDTASATAVVARVTILESEDESEEDLDLSEGDEELARDCSQGSRSPAAETGPSVPRAARPDTNPNGAPQSCLATRLYSTWWQGMPQSRRVGAH